MTNETRHTISESADKITVTTKVKRGDGTRDEDRLKLKIKGDDPDAVATRVRDTLDALDDEGVTDTLRETQPEGSE